MKLTKPQLTKPQTIFLSIVGVILLILILIFAGALPGKKDISEKITINVWGTDDESIWRSTINQYRADHRTTEIIYTEIEEKDYSEKLINAFAAGVGPDIFFVDNNDVLKRFRLIAEVPLEKIDLFRFQDLFVQSAETDLVLGEKIYALPLYIDSLAFAYNRDLFDQSEIAQPPQLWNELDSQISKIIIKDNEGLSLSAVALGGAENSITHSSDILNLMLMQAGQDIVNENLSRVSLDSAASRRVFERYLSYTDKNSELWAWGSDKDSITAFSKGEVAAIFIYQKDIEKLDQLNPLFSYKITPMLQNDLDNRIDYPSYDALAVYSKTNDVERAWDFVIFATTNESIVGRYINLTDRASALRSLIPYYQNLPVKGVFAKQALTSRSWIQPGEEEVISAINNALKQGLENEKNLSQALREASNLLEEEYRKLIE